MKKLLVILLALAVTSIARPTSASTSASVVFSVHVTVAPSITVAVPHCDVEAGAIGTGEFEAQMLLRVDANMDKVGIFVEASDLFKGDDPSGADVAPIPVKAAKLEAENPGPTHDDGDRTDFRGVGTPIGDFQTKKTNTVWIEGSRQFGVGVLYFQADPERPQGEYSGKIRLTALLLED